MLSPAPYRFVISWRSNVLAPKVQAPKSHNNNIVLCPVQGFLMSYFTRHTGCMSISGRSSEHKGCMSISRKSSEHKGCMSTMCSKRIGQYVIIHNVNSRQEGVELVGIWRVCPSQKEINYSIRPNNSCGC